MTDSEAPATGALRDTREDRRLVAIIVGLTLLSLLPVWYLPYFPTVDGPSHLEVAWILRNWADAPDAIRDLYELNLDAFPNWVSHAVLAGLMFVVSPPTAEKILLTGFVLLWVLATGYFLRSVHRRATPYLLLSLPFIHSYPLYMGFYNFMMSVPLSFLAIGYWWRRRERPREFRTMLVLNALLILTYFFHLAGPLLALGSILLLAAIRDRFRPRAVLAQVGAFLPSCVLPAYYLITRWRMPVDTTAGSPPLTELLGLEILFSFDRTSLVLGWVLAGLLAVLIGATVFRETLVRCACGAGWRIRGRAEDGFLLLSVVFAAGWFLTPDQVASGSYMRERLGIYPVIALLAWFTVRLGRRPRLAVIVLATVITVCQILIPLPGQAAAARGLRKMAETAAHVPAGETVMPICLFSHMHEPGSTIGVYLHAIGYHTLAGGVGLFNYSAQTSYFPLRYREGKNPGFTIGNLQGLLGDLTPWRYPRPVDWIVMRYPKPQLVHWPRVHRENAMIRWVMASYAVVEQRGEITLLRRKPGPWPPPAPGEDSGGK